MKETLARPPYLGRRASPWATSIFRFITGWSFPSIRASRHRFTWTGVLALSVSPSSHNSFRSPVCRFESPHGRPLSVISSPCHPLTPSHHLGAKWIRFSKYSFAASVLGLLMSHGNCFCYFPKWKSTSEEQLVCGKALLPRFHPPSYQSVKLQPWLLHPWAGPEGPTGGMCWWWGNRISELLCLYYIGERQGGRGRARLLLLISRIPGSGLCFSMYLKR